MDAWPWFATPAIALLAGIAALAPLGVQVLARGVVFIDLAVAQGAAAAALWIAAAIDHPSAAATRLAAVAGGLATAAIVAAVVRRRPSEREALIGLVYVVGAAVAVLGARVDPHGRDRLAQLLAADVLWADASQALTLGAAALAVWVLAALLRRSRWPDVVFYPAFAVVASLSVPALGLVLVFAALIVPAAWQRAGVPLRRAVPATFASATAGLALSWALDWPSGACVALALGAHGLAVALRPARAGPRHA